MITTNNILDLYEHYVSETNKSKEKLDITHTNKDAVQYYINNEISKLLWSLFYKSAQNDEDGNL